MGKVSFGRVQYRGKGAWVSKEKASQDMAPGLHAVDTGNRQIVGFDNLNN